jgi:hypothetical protein
MSKYGYKIWVLRADNEGHCNAVAVAVFKQDL